MTSAPTLDEIAHLVSTCTGAQEFSYLPRFDIALEDGSRVALIAPDHRYAKWGNFDDKIVFWDPLGDGPYHVVASPRAGITTLPLDERVTNKIPVYDLQRMSDTVVYPPRVDTQGTVKCYFGSATDTARDYYEGKFLYGIKLDSGLKILVAGDGLPDNISLHTKASEIHNGLVFLSAAISGRRDLIGRPIYLASKLERIAKAA